MTRLVGSGAWLAVMMLCWAVPVSAQVDVKKNAMVLYGSAARTSSPATIDMKKVEKETPEYKTIKSDGVRKGTARYELLIAKMHKRIKKAAKAAAESKSCDCVVRKGDIKDKKGKSVSDLTEETIEQLDSSADGL